ncbi:DUF6705 domain-containing protein [Flavobacterium antarcticum]|uniref:DUF6705 family protein n=1 Tax=Flavobacterium antarcticum TaxID=271155 RepID=UPI000410B55C|nr:DUF6705 family protein [Flavobacterium antarcticum]
MKKFIPIVIVLISNTVIGQTEIPLKDYFKSNNMYIDNVYFKDVDNSLGKFTGIWEYNSGPYYLKLIMTKLIKVDYTSPKGTRQYRDILVGNYIYKYNGVIVYNTIPIDNLNLDTRLNYIDGHDVKDLNTVNLHYNEPSTTSCSRTKRAKINLTYLLTLASQPKKMKWERIDWREIQGIGCATDDYDTSSFKIPANLILTKIN